MDRPVHDREAAFTDELLDAVLLGDDVAGDAERVFGGHGTLGRSLVEYERSGQLGFRNQVDGREAGRVLPQDGWLGPRTTPRSAKSASSLAAPASTASVSAEPSALAAPWTAPARVSPESRRSTMPPASGVSSRYRTSCSGLRYTSSDTARSAGI